MKYFKPSRIKQNGINNFDILQSKLPVVTSRHYEQTKSKKFINYWRGLQFTSRI